MGRWTELALKLAQAKRLGEFAQADAVMRELAPLASQTARRVHAAYASLRKQRAADFLAIAPALIWKKIERFEEWYLRELSESDRARAAKEYFAAWCYVELRYRYFDAAREQSDEQRLLSLAPDRPIADPRWQRDQDDNDEFELPPEELERIREWDPLDGVVLFCLTGLWDRLPAGLWTSWLEQLGIEEPFPPEEYLRAAGTRKRAVLAASLNVSRDVIYQRWRRLKARFSQQIPSVGVLQ
jgi:hypothetical protein